MSGNKVLVVYHPIPNGMFIIGFTTLYSLVNAQLDPEDNRGKTHLPAPFGSVCVDTAICGIVPLVMTHSLLSSISIF